MNLITGTGESLGDTRRTVRQCVGGNAACRIARGKPYLHQPQFNFGNAAQFSTFLGVELGRRPYEDPACGLHAEPLRPSSKAESPTDFQPTHL